jgi:SAM-dependent methyltransferase
VLYRTAVAYDEAFWERYFRHYDALDGAPPYRDLQDRVAELAGTGRVLDAGCGTGNLLRRLVVRGARPVGLDANRAGLARARSKVPGVPLVHASLEEALPFPDASFDTVTSVNVLYALTAAGQARFLADARRVLAPGGALVVASPLPHSRPLAVYGESLRRWLRELGPVAGAVRIARFLPPTAAILYYSALAQRHEGRTYHFLEDAALAASLERAGFTPGPPERAYAGQVVLLRASR